MKKKNTHFIFYTLIGMMTGFFCFAVAEGSQAEAPTESTVLSIEIEEVPQAEFLTLEDFDVSYSSGPNNCVNIQQMEVFVDVNLETYTMDELLVLIAEANDAKVAASELADAARELGWPEDSEAVQSAKAEWWNAQLAIEVYQARYDVLFAEAEAERIRWEKKMAEYPAATEVWLYMKSLGWNDYVCAGIMGNLMAEVGGQTLKLQYMLISDDGYFGMCQWSRGYSQIWGKGLQDQYNFLNKTIKYEMDTFGHLYKRGFNLNAFLNMDNTREAALAFAKCYERCHSRTYVVRQNNAEKAYDYFVNR